MEAKFQMQDGDANRTIQHDSRTDAPGVPSFRDQMADIPVHAHSIATSASLQPVLQLLMFSLIPQTAVQSHDFYFRQLDFLLMPVW